MDDKPNPPEIYLCPICNNETENGQYELCCACAGQGTKQLTPETVLLMKSIDSLRGVLDKQVRGMCGLVSTVSLIGDRVSLLRARVDLLDKVLEELAERVVALEDKDPEPTWQPGGRRYS